MRSYWLPFLLAALVSGCSGGDDTDGGNNGINCTRSSDCSGGLVCVQGMCKASGSVPSNGQCTASRDCQSGLYCDPVATRCATAGGGLVGAPCAGDSQCTQALRCELAGFGGTCRAAGTADLGDACQQSSECLAALFCGAGRTCQPLAAAFPPLPGANCLPDSGPFHSYFEVPRPAMPPRDFFRLPYPNDIRVQAAAPRLDMNDFPRLGNTVLGVDLVDLYVDTLVEDFDGFSPIAAVSFRFSQDLDFGFLNANARTGLLFVDLDDSEGLGGITYSYTNARNKLACENFLTVSPHVSAAPLRGGHTYAVVLTSAVVRSAGGASATQDADLAAVLGATRPTDATLGRAWDAYTKLRAWMAGEGVAAAQVMNAAVFTVSDPAATMQKVATAAAAQPAPVLSSLFLCGSGGTDACDDGTEARRCGADNPDFVEIHGKMSLPIFQSGTAPYLRPADGGGLNVVGGNVTKVRNEEVCFALTMPKGTAPPTAGWPLVVYSHGTGGSFQSFIRDGIAERMAKATTKIAVLSFDNVGHGARRAGSTRSPEELVFNVANPRAARDNFVQGAADLLAAFRVPASAVPASWTGPTIKLAPKVVFFGHSQGATHGALALPFQDDAAAAVLSGAGANLGASLLTKSSPSSTLDGIRFLLGDTVNAGHPMMTLWQQFFDRSDPANTNRLIIQRPPTGRTAKHVYMSWGTSDTFTPHDTLLWNALTLGLTPAAPILESDPDFGEPPATVARPISRNLGGTVTGTVIQYNRGDADGHFVATRNATAQADWTAFVTSFFAAAGVPTIP